jgi:hypothetical protein
MRCLADSNGDGVGYLRVITSSSTTSRLLRIRGVSRATTPYRARSGSARFIAANRSLAGNIGRRSRKAGHRRTSPLKRRGQANLQCHPLTRCSNTRLARVPDRATVDATDIALAFRCDCTHPWPSRLVGRKEKGVMQNVQSDLSVPANATLADLRVRADMALERAIVAHRHAIDRYIVFGRAAEEAVERERLTKALEMQEARRGNN